MLALASVVGACQAIQPTKNADGSQTASSAGRQVLATVDAAAPPTEVAVSSLVPYGLGVPLAGLIAWGVKRLHDKLDDLTPSGPTITTTSPPPGT
jgi:hypothetical protein